MYENYRSGLEQVEDLLAPGAVRSSDSRGRCRPEKADGLRTCFQSDCERIVSSKAFRRLAHKTQVFLAPEGDHYRVRLTHTLEVSLVARTIARALRLNEDLTEAICLGHDLGHTPFGHLGEEVVAKYMPGFRHNLQSLRVVDVLEDLNLSWEVRDGIANHTWSMPMPSTLEGQVTRFADRIAYLNHDIDDAARAGILEERDLPPATRKVLGGSHRARVESMVLDLASQSTGSDAISMSSEMFEAMGITRDFLFKRVYLGRIGSATRDGVERVVMTLLEHYETASESDGPPEGTLEPRPDPKAAAVDYVAGMTDRFALRAFEALAGAPAPTFGALV
jgi:dGTPase